MLGASKVTTYFDSFDAGQTGPLGPDEHVIWQGKPYGGLMWRGPGLVSPLFGWAWLLFCLLWTGAASGIQVDDVLQAIHRTWIGEATGFGVNEVFHTIRNMRTERFLFVAFAIPFLWMGFYMAVLQYPWDAHIRRNTVYSLTNRRAIILRSGPRRREMSSYPIAKETQLEFDDLAGGSIWFAKSVSTGRYGATETPIGFVGIPDAQRVYRQMLEIQQGAQ